MQVESKIRNIKGRTSYLNQRPRRTKSTCASSPFDSAKVVRNTETAKRNLEKLAEKYKGINNVEGFLNDLWLALGLHNQGGNKKGGKPSRYALYQLQDGTKLSISIRASAHNANANKYVEHPPVPDINLSIVLQKKMRKNQFKSNSSVNIGEYVYVNQKIQNVESPLSQIANSLIGFLSNGEYNDTTGVAIVHGNMQTPQEVVNNQTLNCNRNMNKKQIRLTESDLKQIVKESVNKILNEAYGTPNKWTKSATYNINQARNDDRNYIKNADNEPVNASLADFLNDMLHVSDKLSDQNDVLRKLDGKYYPYASPSYKPYVQELYKIGDKLSFIVHRMISIANMEEGEQPDEYYDINHESYKQKQKRLNYGGMGNGGEDRHDYSGLAGWGG